MIEGTRSTGIPKTRYINQIMKSVAVSSNSNGYDKQ